MNKCLFVTRKERDSIAADGSIVVIAAHPPVYCFTPWEIWKSKCRIYNVIKFRNLCFMHLNWAIILWPRISQKLTENVLLITVQWPHAWKNFGSRRPKNVDSVVVPLLHIDLWQGRMFELCKQRDWRTHQCK